MDIQLLNTILGAAAANRMRKEPVWLMIVGSSGAGKTLMVSALEGLRGPPSMIVSTLSSEGSLLSAAKPYVPKKGEPTPPATGGLLKRMGNHGLVIFKDFTTILSMSDRSAKPGILAALREIHDGKWVREVGTEGGKSLSWQGHLGIIGCCTQAWDNHHATIAMMGDRFLVTRMSSVTDQEAAEAAMEIVRKRGKDNIMRHELREAAHALVQPIGVTVRPKELPPEIEECLGNTLAVVMRARTPVTRDPRGNIIGDVPEPESPHRMIKGLDQLIQGCLAIGMGLQDAFDVAMRCARDSIPRTRMLCIQQVLKYKEVTASELADRLDMNWGTVSRTLKDLVEARLIAQEVKKEGAKSTTVYHLRPYVDLTQLWTRIEVVDGIH